MKYPRIAEDRSQLEQFAKETEAGSFGPKVELAGNSLVIPEQEQPQPVATIDGVAYFHKQEFDLEAIAEEASAQPYQAFLRNLLTGVLFPDPSEHAVGMYYIKTGDTPTISLQLAYVGGPNRVNLNEFTSRAFTVVDTQEEVGYDTTKICLPTCSAYYGFLSEDGKTFISYYNLKTDGAPEYVDSIKQGNAVIPLKDVRLPDATSADVGKVLGVNDEGEFVLEPVPTSEPVEITLPDNPTNKQFFDALVANVQPFADTYLRVKFTWNIGGGGNEVMEGIFSYLPMAAAPNIINFSSGNASGKLSTYRGSIAYGNYDPDGYFQSTMYRDLKKVTIPNLPFPLDTAKTYVLKVVNGTPTWVEEIA